MAKHFLTFQNQQNYYNFKFQLTTQNKYNNNIQDDAEDIPA